MQGTLEGITHLSAPGALAFWLPALWGGGALVLLGVFATRPERPWLSVALVSAGACAGSLATLWTVVLPLIAMALVLLTIRRAER